jgi:hypothetical protein
MCFRTITNCHAVIVCLEWLFQDASHYSFTRTDNYINQQRDWTFGHVKGHLDKLSNNLIGHEHLFRSWDLIKERTVFLSCEGHSISMLKTLNQQTFILSICSEEGERKKCYFFNLVPRRTPYA